MFSAVVQEPHPSRMTAENAARRLARLDTLPANIFEHLAKLRSFKEVCLNSDFQLSFLSTNNQ